MWWHWRQKIFSELIKELASYVAQNVEADRRRN
jgi:hypothetical protein